jgi:hypothetical protein
MSFQFKDIEFKGMMYNPSKVPEGKSIFDVYKDLSKHSDFKTSPGPDLDNEKVMLYIICLYDKETPYRRKYPDVLKRKIEVAHDCGFDMDEKGIFSSAVEDMLKGKNDKVQRKIVEYVRMHRDYQYTYHVAIDNSYYNLMLEVMEGKTKNLEALKTIKKELEESQKDILNGDDNKYTRDAVLRYMEEERLYLRSEDIALKLSKGETPISLKEIQ